MNRRLLTLTFLIGMSAASAFAQLNNSGISAGFFDASGDKTINFSNFHLPPLSVLFENAKATPSIELAASKEQSAIEETRKQRLHIFSYLSAHASYMYGKADTYGNSSTTLNPVIYQYQGSTQSYWNVGVSLSLPLEDVLDLKASVKRKRLAAEQAGLEKDDAFDKLKLQIATLYVKITNNLVTLKSASENAAINQGAGVLDADEFHRGNMDIKAFADTKQKEQGAVSAYQDMQTQITTDIINLEILTHTPILTNSTTDVTIEKVDDKKK
jgi:outer membrane protein TolC